MQLVRKQNTKELQAYQVGSATMCMLSMKAGAENPSPAFAQRMVQADWYTLGSSTEVHSRTHPSGTDDAATSFCRPVACCRQE